MIPLSGELARGTQARGTQARGTQVQGTQVRGAQAWGTQVRGALAARDLALMAMFAAVTAVLAYVRIPLPFSPVPITGQTFGLMLAGLLLGPRLVAVSATGALLMV